MGGMKMLPPSSSSLPFPAFFPFMETPRHPRLGPFLALTFIYFLVGFLTTVNGQFQGPLQSAFLSDAGTLKNTFITLIPFFFFLAYLVNGNIGSRWINRYGYKTTLIRGLLFMVLGLAVFFLSAWFTVRYGDLHLTIAGAEIPYGYFIFLAGSYAMGTSATLLQVVINPYVTSYELKGTQPVQRLNIVCAVNSFGTTIAPFFVTGVLFAGLPMENVHVRQLMTPLLILGILIALITLVTKRLYLPDLRDTTAGEGEKLERGIWSFRHLTLGVIAIFFYVGAEVSVGINVNLHALELGNSDSPLLFLGSSNLVVWGVDLGIPALLASLYWGGLMAGRIVSGWLSHISPRVQLTAATSAAALLTPAAIYTHNLWVLVSVGLFHSVMWGCIFTLATVGLKKYTAKASGIFMMGVFGGAVFPFLQGVLADSLGSWRWSWMLVFLCELVMLAYALAGSRVRKQDLPEETD